MPLQSWLLDAMEGPTPVSALIHAATMVTAGVYLIARSNAIFDVAPHARLVVEIVGAITLMFGAIIGCAKDDIKKVLAGLDDEPDRLHVPGRRASVRRLRVRRSCTCSCHGFFKAGMFLGAGSVMHGNERRSEHAPVRRAAQGHAVDLRHVRLGYLAIIGMIPFSGFFSKDKIIEAAFDKGGAPARSSARSRCSAPGSRRST